MLASVITSVVAAGTMMSLVAAARMQADPNAPQTVEAADFAQQTIERFRSNIACRQPGDPTGWFDATCAATLPVGWQDDPIPAGAATESILPAERRYCVQPTPPAECAAGNCYTIQVQVCWNGAPCPAIGAPCP